MNFIAFLCVSVFLFGASDASESTVEIGFRLTSNPPVVEWKEGSMVNLTCRAVCTTPCLACSSIKYVIDERKKEYLPKIAYDDFKMYPVTNVTDTYQSKCRIEQTVTIMKVQKNESGMVKCVSITEPARVGIAFLYIYYNVNFTNATLPTISTTANVDIESSNAKVAVTTRTFNATVDGNNFPYVSCSVVSGSTATTMQWNWGNGTELGTEQDVETTNTPSTESPVLVESRLKFRNFAEKAAQIVGEYKCMIETNGSVRYPAVYSAPVVKMSDKDYRSSMEGDTMTQSCSIIAYPGAVITWTKDNQTLVVDGERIKLSADNTTLTIGTLKQTDAGLYICSAENSLGLGQAYIKLRVKDRLAALWPFLGILAEVIILVTIILLYEKKRAAQKRTQEEQEAADVNKDDQRNANDSDVRHRPVKT